MFFILKEGSRTRGHKSTLVKEQRRLDIRKYSLLHRMINEWNKLSNDCVNIFDTAGLYVDRKNVGLSINQWPLATRNL